MRRNWRMTEVRISNDADVDLLVDGKPVDYIVVKFINRMNGIKYVSDKLLYNVKGKSLQETYEIYSFYTDRRYFLENELVNAVLEELLRYVTPIYYITFSKFSRYRDNYLKFTDVTFDEAKEIANLNFTDFYINDNKYSARIESKKEILWEYADEDEEE